MTAEATVSRVEHLEDGSEVATYLLGDDSGIRVEVMSYGGIIRSLVVPDARGAERSVVLALDSLADYTTVSPYFGALIGRYANRIDRGHFELDGTSYDVTVNDGTGSLHGGRNGFDRKVWRVEDAGPSALTLSYSSPSGEEGYPGRLEVRATYSVHANRTLRIEYTATTDAPTPVSLTNHSYFNLAGEGAGTALQHRAQIAADYFLPVSPELIPTGERRAVEGTEMDFRSPHTIEDRIRNASEQLRLSKGYDHNWVLSRERLDESGLAFAARFEEPESGRSPATSTTAPVADFCTGHFLDGTLAGPAGKAYRQGDAFAFEPERPSNGPNLPDAEATILRPGQSYRSATEYRFGVV